MMYSGICDKIRTAQGVCRQRKETYKQASAEVSKLEKQLEKAQKPRKIKQAQLKNLKSQVRPGLCRHARLLQGDLANLTVWTSMLL